jgi:hypothetical protein
MSRPIGWRAAAVIAALSLPALLAGSAPRGASAQAGAALRGPDAFAGIADRTQRSSALFLEAAKVFQHPRCQNCHSGDDRARQGDEGRPHQPAVRHGADGLGAPGLRCPACHGDANYDAAGMPGVPGWHLAPAVMGLRGQPLAAICEQIKDADRNGSRSLDDLVTHVSNDRLVVWAWTPGQGRGPAPGTHATFVALMRAWVDTSAACPARP